MVSLLLICARSHDRPPSRAVSLLHFNCITNQQNKKGFENEVFSSYAIQLLKNGQRNIGPQSRWLC